MRVWRIVVAAAFLIAAPAGAQAPLPLIPLPASVQPLPQGFTVANGTAISAQGKGAAIAGRLLSERVQTDRGLMLQRSPSGAIRIERDRSVEEIGRAHV